MPTIQSVRSAPAGSVATHGVVSFFERLVDGVAAWRSARATSLALKGLSDKQLADIGLVRGDIAEVAETLARR